MRRLVVSSALHFAMSAALCLAAGFVSSPAKSQCNSGLIAFALSPAIRAYGMGDTGAADAADPLNAFYNPAVISSSGETFFAGAYAPLFRSEDDDTYVWHAAAGAGFSFAATQSIELHLGAGAAFSYVAHSSWRDPNILIVCNYLLDEKLLALTLGGEAVYRDMLHLGIGIALKPLWFKAEQSYPYGAPPATGNGIAYDLGFLLSADFLKGVGLRLSPSIGFSVLNMGGDIVLWDDWQGDLSLPRNYRLGLGMRFEGPRKKFLGTEVPLFVLAVNWDGREDYDEEPFYSEPEGDWDMRGLGAEGAFLETLFLRIGSVAEPEEGDLSTGVGIGLATGRFRGRVDYAFVDRERPDEYKYGVSFGYRF
jgi:hypothetical protein